MPPPQPRLVQRASPPQKIEGPRAAAPQFSKPGGVYTGHISVELLATNPAAIIRFTLDGTEPGAASQQYSGPIAVEKNTLIRAVAFEPGVHPSPSVSETYGILDETLQGFTSNLPLVIIQTFGQQLSREQTVPASLRVIPPVNGRTPILGGKADYEGRCDIRLRGFSSLRAPKRSYSIRSRTDPGDPLPWPMLGMPKDADWVLYAPYSDKTLIRDVLAYELSNKMGRYAARTRFVEVFVNRFGGKISGRDYVGVYVFEEKIKRAPDRVNIQKLTPQDNAEPNMTGGYIIKRDHVAQPMDGPFGMLNQTTVSPSGDERGFATSRGLQLFYVEPKEEEITSAQKSYIARYMNQLEKALYGSNFRNPEEGYAKYLDVDSFIDQFLIVELSKNIDGFRYSCYMFKDRGGKLRVEPIWDWNLSFGNANYHEGWTPEQWYWPLLRETEVCWYRRLRQDPAFNQRLQARWTELRQGVLATERILQRVDQFAAELSEAQARNFQRWPILGQPVNPNWFIGESYQEEVDWMKQWIQERMHWIDSHLISAGTVAALEQR